MEFEITQQKKNIFIVSTVILIVNHLINSIQSFIPITDKHVNIISIGITLIAYIVIYITLIKFFRHYSRKTLIISTIILAILIVGNQSLHFLENMILLFGYEYQDLSHDFIGILTMAVYLVWTIFLFKEKLINKKIIRPLRIFSISILISNALGLILFVFMYQTGNIRVVNFVSLFMGITFFIMLNFIKNVDKKPIANNG
ncbi:hypothetical protein [Carboxylicivirga marina]|uniref:Uncharacterized protein n=1 Tax=Carboxylicivirga marina TaxID=2800988 RepID=A0ABS1HQ01_9BACT|nr:hypothetical protein [Carboxylicivirga marina]MBK3519622.1 hypothetical protein [Carboxylicivirga marina]